jgi:hypothetical protein
MSISRRNFIRASAGAAGTDLVLSSALPPAPVVEESMMAKRKIDGIVRAGNYPPLPPYGYSAFDISPALVTGPPSDGLSVAGLSVGLAAQNLPAQNCFGLVVENCTPSAYAGSMRAVYAADFEVDHNGSGTMSNAFGMQAELFNNGSGTITAAYGGVSHIVNTGQGSIDSASGLTSVVYNQGTGSVQYSTAAYFRTGASDGTVGTDYTVEIDSPLTGGTFTNPHIGLCIFDQTAGGALPSALAIQVLGGKVDLGPGGMKVTGLRVFANNAAANAGGLTAGDFYRTGADPDVVCVVH